MTTSIDLAKLLTESERDQSFANMRPKDAATLIIIDRIDGVPKVLLGRRHARHKFMPDKFVFPGGRVESGDRILPVASSLHPVVEARLLKVTQRPSAARARAIAIAAIRETFEETGLLIGAPLTPSNARPLTPSNARPLTPSNARPPTPSNARPLTLSNARPLSPANDPFAAAGLYPDLQALHFVTRAITPPRRARRFDTRFFAVDAARIGHRAEGIVGADSELVELAWIPLNEAQRLDMPTITQVVLAELEARVAAGLGHDLPVPFYKMSHRRFLRALL